MKPIIETHEAFKALQMTHKLFEQVKVAQGGYGVYWNEDIDLSCNDLYYEGKKCQDIETNLTDEEKEIIEEGDRQYKEHPEDFVPLESLL